jgi:hypothetical protein
LVGLERKASIDGAPRHPGQKLRVVAGVGEEATFGAQQATLDGRERYVASIGDLQQLQPVNVAERERDAVVSWQALEHDLDRAQRSSGFDIGHVVGFVAVFLSSLIAIHQPA